MNIGLISKGQYTTMSEQRTPDGFAITNGLAAWQEELAVGKAMRDTLLDVLDYNDITETIEGGTIHVLSTIGKSSQTIEGIDWIYAKVAYKLFEQHPEIEFNWIQNTHESAHDFYLSQMDTLIVYATDDDEDVLARVHAIRLAQPDMHIVRVDAKTKEQVSYQRT